MDRTVPMKRIALVMPVFNHLDFTRRCLDTLRELIFNQNFKTVEYRVVVIDDGSTDGTAAWISSAHPEVDLVPGDGSLWWSGGVNAGARYAMEVLGADYILLWNNDVTPAADYFTQLDLIVKEADEDTLIGSKIYYHGNENLVWSYGGIFNPVTGKKYMYGMDHPDSDRYEQPMQVDWLPGMGTLVPVRVIESIGFWDEKVFPQYHGDSDFTYRASRAGYRVVVQPSLKMWNDKTSSGLTHGNSVRGLFRMLTNIRSNLNIRKNIIFYQRYATSPRAYCYLCRTYLKVIGGFLKWRLLSVFGKNRT